jgi:DNA polymerase-1
VLAYRSAIEHEIAEETEDGYWTWTCDINKVKASAKEYLSFLLEHLEAENYILCLSDDRGNFRKSISSEYKENRVRLRRPVVLRPIRQWLIDDLGALIYPDLEGDDVMGIIATDPSREDERVICSIDKDMQTIPGLLYFEDKLQTITKEEAKYHHFYQTLIGDTIDGYKGCPGVGAVTAKKALEDDCSWETVLKLFKKAKLTEEDALKQAQMARILHYSDYDHELQKPILWRPEQ